MSVPSGAKFLAGCIAIALGISACGSTSSSSSIAATSAASSSSTSSATTSAATSTKHYNVVFIPQNLGIPYFDRMETGFESAAQELGYSTTMTGPTTADAGAQIPVIQAQIEKHVSAIAIQVNDPNAETPTLKEARAQGIKVVAVNSDQLAGTRDGAVTPVDFNVVGYQMLALLGKLMNYSGDFGIVSATTTAPFQQTVIGDVQHELATNPTYKNMKLAKIVYGNDVPATAEAQTQALLSAEPNLKAVFSPTNVGEAAAAQVIQSRGLSGKLILTGNCSPDQVRQYIEDGLIKACQLWDPATQAKVAGYLIHGLLTGKLSGAPGTTFLVPGTGQETVGKDGVIVAAAKLTTFTKANIGQYHGF